MAKISSSTRSKLGGRLGQRARQSNPAGFLRPGRSIQQYPTRSGMTSPFDMIHRLIEEGFPVFPVEAGGKKPAIKNGFKAASTQKAKIDLWFRGHPELNYGIRTGAPSGFFALDVDGPEGQATIAALEKKHGQLPTTIKVKTPHGQHCYFRMPGYPIRNSVKRIGPGVDIRGDGGYVVGAGSRTPDGTYRFAPGRQMS